MVRTQEFNCKRCGKGVIPPTKQLKYCSRACSIEQQNIRAKAYGQRARDIAKGIYQAKVEEPKRRDIIAMLSKCLQRYPIIVEVNYTQMTNKIKKIEYFTEEESAIYNPTKYALKKAYWFMARLCYIYLNYDRVKKNIEWRNGIEARKKQKEERRQAKVAKSKRVISNVLNNYEIKRIIKERNKAMVSDLLSKHYLRDNIEDIRKKDIYDIINGALVPIPEEMWGVIAKYK